MSTHFIVHQVNQDIPIWENKVYLEEPTLCDGDGPIAKYRKWFKQFYVA
jgi:3-ketosteroid 9alpha-monooxygenase subunit A